MKGGSAAPSQGDPFCPWPTCRSDQRELQRQHCLDLCWAFTLCTNKSITVTSLKLIEEGGVPASWLISSRVARQQHQVAWLPHVIPLLKYSVKFFSQASGQPEQKGKGTKKMSSLLCQSQAPQQRALQGVGQKLLPTLHHLDSVDSNSCICCIEFCTLFSQSSFVPSLQRSVRAEQQHPAPRDPVAVGLCPPKPTGLCVESEIW